MISILEFAHKCFIAAILSFITIVLIHVYIIPLPGDTYIIPFLVLIVMYVWIFYKLKEKYVTYDNPRKRKRFVVLRGVFGLFGMVFGFVGLIFSGLMRLSGSVSGLLGTGSMYGYKKHKETGEIKRDDPAADAVKRISEKAIYGKNYKNRDDDKYEKY
jgi:hypothetical protein